MGLMHQPYQSNFDKFPSDWPIVRVDDFSCFVTSGSRGWAKYYSSTGSLFVRITNLSHEKIKLDLSRVKKVKVQANDSEATRTALRLGDVLISITADIGAIGLIDEKVPNPAYINQHIACVRFHDDSIHQKYFAYALLSEWAQKKFTENVDLGAKTGINLDTVKNISFPLPPLKEQQAIAEALSDIEELILSLEKLVIKKTRLKSGILNKIYSELKSTGEIVERDLTEIAKITMGQSPSSEYYNQKGDGLPLIQGNADLVKRKTIRRNYTSFSPKIANEGDIILTVRAPVGDVAIASEKVCLGRGVCGLKTNLTLLKFYFEHMEGKWSKFSSGSTFDAINQSQLSELKILTPASEKLESQLSALLQELTEDINTIEAQLIKAKHLKSGMMQELLTGRIRLT